MCAPRAKKRRDTPEKEKSEDIVSLSPHELHPPEAHAAADRPHPQPISESKESHCQESPLGFGRGEDGAGVDRISDLPDAVLGEIVALLSTKDATRTQSLASRWRHLWRSAPLNLDHSSLPADEVVQIVLISRIIAARRGPVRRLSVPAVHLHHSPETVDGWLRSPALDNLQELVFNVGEAIYGYARTPLRLLPASTFRFSATLRIGTMSQCDLLDGMLETFHFPQLRQLGLESVMISEDSLHGMIAGCPVLECLLLNKSSAFSSIRINSSSLISICLGVSSVELIIEDAPSLERLLQLDPLIHLDISIISAPKLETLGCLSDIHDSKLVFGTTVFQKLHAISFMTVVCSVKTLALSIYNVSLDMVISLMRCFPCLEKLCIQIESNVSTDKNLWRRKHRDIIKCFDIRLKMVVLEIIEAASQMLTLLHSLY